MFSVLLTVISLVAYLELSITFVHMNIVRQRIRNDFKQSLMSKDTRKATRRASDVCFLRRDILSLKKFIEAKGRVNNSSWRQKELPRAQCYALL